MVKKLKKNNKDKIPLIIGECKYSRIFSILE